MEINIIAACVMLVASVVGAIVGMLTLAYVARIERRQRDVAVATLSRLPAVKRDRSKP